MIKATKTTIAVIGLIHLPLPLIPTIAVQAEPTFTKATFNIIIPSELKIRTKQLAIIIRIHERNICIVLSLITVGIIIGEQTVSTFTSKYLSAISAMSLNNAIIDFMKKTINTIAVIIVPTEPYEVPDIAPANLSTKFVPSDKPKSLADVCSTSEYISDID